MAKLETKKIAVKYPETKLDIVGGFFQKSQYPSWKTKDKILEY